jgi:heme-degrading monooxygenase HmoA
MSDDGIYEIARLHIVPGRREEFTAAASQALEVLSAAPGCRSARLLHCMEEETEPIFFVHWDTVEDHTAFREAEAFAAYRAPIAGYFADAPSPTHYLLAATGGPQP